jgi:hypothetical protein
MIYYPKANITPNLFSNGEYILNGSNEPYTGYYFSTYDGKFFTGREPGDGANLELTANGSNLQGEATSGDIDYRFVGQDNYFYSTSLKSLTPITPVTLTPQVFYPNPTLSDYQTGEIVRYFVKKTNENIYIETQSLVQNSLYTGFSIPWLITGDRDNVANVNKRIVALKEAELKILGLGLYLKNNYLQFYK